MAQAPRSFTRPLVIGAGPCGIFATLVLAKWAFGPFFLNAARSCASAPRIPGRYGARTCLNPESNVQFGEGGAGTFSDGKLYSQIKDPRFLGRKVLNEFVQAGAPEDILIEAHPHIGTFRLVTVVESLRAAIEGLGGEYRFESKVTELTLKDRAVKGVRLGTAKRSPPIM